MKLYEQFLEEYKRTTQSRDTRVAKIKRDIGARASKEADVKGDLLSQRMKYHRQMYNKLKQQIMKKYGPRVKLKARS